MSETRSSDVDASEHLGGGASQTSGGASAPPARRGGRGPAALALLLAVLATGLVGWLGWRLDWGRAAAPATDPALIARLETLDGDVRDLRAGVDRLGVRDDELERRLLAVAQQLARLDTEMARVDPRREARWRLAEAGYLLRLARQRAALEGDADGAAALLAEADAVLGRVDDLAVHPVRSAIAAARNALRGAADVDPVGLYLEVEGLEQRVGELPPAPLGFEGFDAPAETVSDTQGSASPAASGLLERLEGLLEFRVHAADAPPPLRDRAVAEEVLRHQLRLALQSAQLALLRGDETLWRSSLTEAREWTRRHFDASAPEVEAFVAELRRIANQPVPGDLPDVSTPLERLEALRARLPTDARASPGGARTAGGAASSERTETGAGP